MKPSCELARATLWKRACGLGRYLLSATVPLLLSLAAVPAQVPQLLNYQGRVQVGTNDFNGTGQFKFALVNADGTTTYWSNDGTPTGQPAGGITLPVTKGLYSVLLGNPALPNMTDLPPAAFTNGDVHLRVWFNDGLNGFQQFVPDQRVVTPAYATTAGSVTGPINVDQLPPSVPRATNGTTTIAGDVVVLGTITAVGGAQSSGIGASGLPVGTILEVLINNQVAPGVRFEGLTLRELSLSRATSDLSWPEIFNGGTHNPFTNPPVTIRLSLPNGGVVMWELAGGSNSTGPYLFEFYRPIGSDGKPYDLVKLMPPGSLPPITRTNFNLVGIGSTPKLHFGGRSSGQPQSASLRLVVDNVNYNNVVFGGVIEPNLDATLNIYLNPTYHSVISQWALGETPTHRSVQVVLAGGLPGTVQLAASSDPPLGGTAILDYEVIVASDGLPIEKIVLEDSN